MRKTISTKETSDSPEVLGDNRSPEKPPPIAVAVSARFSQVLRRTSKALVCPYCSAWSIFQEEAELYNHAEGAHGELIGEYDGDLVAFRKAVREKAQNKAQRSSGSQPTRQSQSAASLVGIKHGSSHRPPKELEPSVVFTRPLSADILHVRNLTIDVDHDSPMPDISSETAQASVHSETRKRPAVADSPEPGTKNAPAESEMKSASRRTKARSGGYGSDHASAALDPEFDRRAGSVSHQPHQGRSLARRLFDPSRDSPHPTRSIEKRATLRSREGSLLRRDSHDYAGQDQPEASRFQGTSANPTPPGLLNLPQPITSNAESRSSNRSLVQDEEPNMIPQPETRPISQEQLVAEVKGIYAGLVMVEAKCIEVDSKQAAALQAAGPKHQPKLNDEQFQALIALHRTLLNEHHDFFLASQHPSATPALKRLAVKYAMPARMWRHGIHSFLELLRHRLPSSLEHMLSFIYLAYSMMALLYETVPAFEDTWVECLGDLGRYRMAIEDEDLRDREVWAGVARMWYSKAADKSPKTGRLYHHLAILARPNALQQLFYYAKSLSVGQPFVSARESILTLFDPVLSQKHSNPRAVPAEAAFIKAQAILFTGTDIDSLGDVLTSFLSLIDQHIGRVTAKFKEQGVYIAVANIAALLGFGSEDNVLAKRIKAAYQTVESQTSVENDSVRPHPEPETQVDEDLKSTISSPTTRFGLAQKLCFSTLDIALQRIGDPNALPHVHVCLAFWRYISRFRTAQEILVISFPWTSLALLVNTLLRAYDAFERLESSLFPHPDKGHARPLPEDFAIRGLEWTDNYFPEDWFTKPSVDEEERALELPSMSAIRQERVLWLAFQITKVCGSLRFDDGTRLFQAITS